jgi:glucose dehydrogenase
LRIAERILSGTIDGRLIALDAQTGKPCSSFGEDGQISVLHGLGSPPPGFAYLTSPPLIIDGLAVVGGWVLDGWSIDMPSGAVRAYDAVTGKFVWAWDIGRPGDPSEPPPGQTYTPGTPNVWAPMSADPELGLIYLPTGNATPDYWGGYRSKLMDRYSSSVVALDARTGAQRWSFQTVHHDLWDYDVPANPILFEFKRGDERIPALAQVTKSGQIFVLDRRDGRPIHEVTEQPMPQGAGEGDWTSPTQPISSVPSVGPPRLTESSMWGFTPFDQISCRMMFRTHRYEGLYAPATVEGSIFYPSMFGAVDWGAATVDEDHGLLVVNSNWLPFLVRLVPRKEADAIEADAIAHRQGPRRRGSRRRRARHSESWAGRCCRRPAFHAHSRRGVC